MEQVRKNPKLSIFWGQRIRLGHLGGLASRGEEVDEETHWERAGSRIHKQNEIRATIGSIAAVRDSYMDGTQ